MDLDQYLKATTRTEPRTEHRALSTPAPAEPVWPTLEPVDVLPNGQPVKLTLRRSLILTDVFGAAEPPFSAVLSIVLLYLCAHERAGWSVPAVVAPGDVRPLWRAPEQLMDAALDWADAALAGLSPAEVTTLATRLWLYHDGTRVTPQKKTAATAEKNAPAPAPSAGSSGSGWPPPETSAGGNGSPITSNSVNSTPPSTAPS